LRVTAAATRAPANSGVDAAPRPPDPPLVTPDVPGRPG
jgi:hypothetical protein